MSTLGSRNWEQDLEREPGSQSFGALSSAQTATAISQDDRFKLANRDAEPPLGVKLTVYRLLNIMTILSFVISKDILTMGGQVAAPTRLDWISGGVLGVVLYWIGLQEQRKAKKWEWFFDSDLAPGIGYCAMGIWCSIGLATVPVLLLLLYSPSFILAVGVNSLMSSWIFYLLYHSDIHFHFVTKLGIVLVTYALLCFLFLGVNALTRRLKVRAWATQRAMCFLNNYEPDALAAAGYSQGFHTSVASSPSLTISFRGF